MFLFEILSLILIILGILGFIPGIYYKSEEKKDTAELLGGISLGIGLFIAYCLWSAS